MFGSVARGDETPESDIDFLVEFEPGSSLFDLMDLQEALEQRHASEAIFTVKLAPNVPFFLGSDDSRYNAGDFSGTADVIDLIRVKNSNAADAVVNLILAS